MAFDTEEQETALDTMSLDELLIHDKESTFMLRMRGDALVDIGVLDGDLMLVERGARPRRGDLVVMASDSYRIRPFDDVGPDDGTPEAVVTAVIRMYGR